MCLQTATPAIPTLSPASFPQLPLPKATVVANSKLFSGLSSTDCALLAQSARLRTFTRHECLFEQDQLANHVYLIVSGTVKLTQLGSSGSEVILWLLGPGRAAGVLGIPTQARHTCSARSIGSCRALSWQWESLDRDRMGPQIRRNVSDIRSQSITELEQRFREVATEKVSVRVANALVRSLPQIGRKSAMGTEVLLSREELAQLTGTTLFTISRLVSKWSQERLIVARREAILVLNADKLLQFTSNYCD